MASETMLIESAERLFSRHITPEVLRAPEAWPASAWNAAEEAGLTRALVPEHAGGFGVPVHETLDLLRVAGAHSVPLPLGETMLGLWLLARAGITLPAGPVTLANADDTSRTPWARHARWLVLLRHDHLELYAASTWRTTHGANLAGEPATPWKFSGRRLRAHRPISCRAHCLPPAPWSGPSRSPAH